MEDVVIRPIREEEIPCLDDFLYEAIFIPEGMEPPERSIIERPELKLYTEAFGQREGDVCLIAEIAGKPAGAVWTRIMEDYATVTWTAKRRLLRLLFSGNTAAKGSARQ